MPKIEQRHREAAEKWMNSTSVSEDSEAYFGEGLGDEAEFAYAQGLADAEAREQARWEAEIDSILSVAGDAERAALTRLLGLMRGHASYLPSALDDAIVDAEERGREEMEDVADALAAVETAREILRDVVKEWQVES